MASPTPSAAKARNAPNHKRRRYAAARRVAGPNRRWATAWTSAAWSKPATNGPFHKLSRSDDIPARISQAHVVISNKAPLRARQPASAHALRYIGITATNMRGYSTASVTQHVFGLMLSLTGKTLGIVGVGVGELERSGIKLAQAFEMRVLKAARPGGAPS